MYVLYGAMGFFKNPCHLVVHQIFEIFSGYCFFTIKNTVGTYFCNTPFAFPLNISLRVQIYYTCIKINGGWLIVRFINFNIILKLEIIQTRLLIK